MPMQCDRLCVLSAFWALNLVTMSGLIAASPPLRAVADQSQAENALRASETARAIALNASTPVGKELDLGSLVDRGEYITINNSSDWNHIAAYLKDFSNPIDSVDVLSRAQLLSHAFQLASNEQLSYETAFNLADYLKRESDYLPWSAALEAFDFVDRVLSMERRYPVFKRYVLRLMDKIFQSFRSIPPKNENEELLYTKLESWACRLDQKICKETAAQALKEYVDYNIPVPVEHRSVVYCYGLRTLRGDYWEAMWHKYKQSVDYQEKEFILSGLSCSSEQHRLEKLLQHTITDGPIREKEASIIILAVSESTHGVEIALKFLNKNFVTVMSYYNSTSFLNKIVTGIATMLVSREQTEEFETFLRTYHHTLVNMATNTVQIAVEKNFQWLSKHQNSVLSVLEEKELEEYLLPDWISPQHYILRFEPDLEEETFSGEMYIRITPLVTTDHIILHSNGIKIISIQVFNEDNQNETLFESYSTDERLDFLNIYLTESLLLNRNYYYIFISFQGSLRDNMYGFYVSTYTDGQGKETKLAATQFQPTHARKAFPCFDEPRFKATFSVAVKTPPHYHALGNMRIMHTRVWDDHSTEAQFISTPKMSTYLLAFVVSDFVSLEESENGIVYRTWARPNALSWGTYSMQVTKPILEELEDFTSFKYTDPNLQNPFDKVDQVALPDFSAGAMENWGLITYRETALLYNDGTASARKSVATIIAHELTHMWFGNLVTTYWWDTTWLNEGFAQYLQYYITNKVKPDWRLMDQFVVDHHLAILTSDSLSTSEALTSPAYTPLEVSARFGSITYSKGASILRMLSNVLGEEDFQKALQLYLRKQRYSTVTPNDLFEQLILHSHETNLGPRYFEGWLRSWTEQPGFPVVYVERFYDYGTVLVSQSRFLLKETTTADSTLYYVPLTWVVQGEDFSLRQPQSYLRDNQVENTISCRPERDQWVIFNVQVTGYYRVNYDSQNWRLLSNYLKDESKALDDIHYLNRAQLLDDAFNLARADQLDYEIAFELSDYLKRETDYIPWTSAFSAFSYLQRMLINNDKYSRFQNYVRHLLEDLYNTFNFEDRDGHIDKLFLNRVTTWACSLLHSHCTASARDALHGFLDQDTPVPADLRSVVYCYGVRHSTNDYWYKLLEEYKTSLDSAERTLIMAGLACSNDENILKELLEHSISGTFIRKQDASSVFSSVYGNSKGIEVALNFLDANFEEVEEYYGSMGAINNIVVGIAGRLTTREQREQMETFVDKYKEDLETTADTALELIDENILWLDKHENTILNILEEFEDPVTSAPETTTQIPETTPQVPETTPQVPETTPQDPETTPQDQETTPQVPETTPQDQETTPQVPETTTQGSGNVQATALLVSLVIVARWIL